MIRTPSQHRPCRCPRLEVELLEDRCLLDGLSFLTDPVVPLIDAGTRARLQDIFVRGQAQGNHANVFSKIGDSITWAPEFLTSMGSSGFDPSNPTTVGSNTNLARTIYYFRSQPVDSIAANSFNHASLSAFPGWTTTTVMVNAPNSPLASELSQTKPAFALIMLGTNDVTVDAIAGTGPLLFQQRLIAIVDATIAQGVIPILSTIPDRQSGGADLEARTLIYNQSIAEVAADEEVPLWNYWLAMQSLPDKGLGADGTHPNSAPGGSDLFTADGLRYGYNMRNFTAAAVLDKLKRVIVDSGAPDTSGGSAVSPETTRFVTGVYANLLGRGPDVPGLNYWGRQIQQGVLSRQEVVRAVWLTPEHRALEVSQYYEAFLHRRPGPSEQAAWVNVFLAGASEADVQADILTSPEYLATHGALGQVVSGMYQDVLGRSPDAAGQAFWEQRFLASGPQVHSTVYSFLTSVETEAQEVNDFFGSFLHRQAEPRGDLFLVALMQQHFFSLEGIGEAILASDEFWLGQT